MPDGLQQSVDKMRADGVGEAAIATFQDAYRRLQAGERGMLAEADIEPVTDIPDAESLPDDPEAARAALDRAVVIKLNGGLGTSMGMDRAKSLLEVKDGKTFLDIIAEQVLSLRESIPTHPRLPLVLMNSFATREDSLNALARHEGLESDVPPDFVQNKVPKLTEEDLTPVSWPSDPSLEWAPPGHGDLYTALETSGMLDTLLEHGYRWAFVSNSDNLGAVLEPRILAWIAEQELPFVMEVADRTAADRKGGHIARRARGGGLVLREVAQTPDDDIDAFQDIDHHRYFNTNTLWIDLQALRGLLDANEGVLGLPMIVNRKTVDPSDKGSTPVIQLETAMGAAIDVFEGAQALRVPRSRFLPVKTTNDLLVLRSDAYVLTDGARLELAPGRDAAPLVDLDSDYYKLIGDFDARFPSGPPSLREDESLTVEGDVTFGAGVVCRGNVRISSPTHPLRIEDGTVLEGG